MALQTSGSLPARATINAIRSGTKLGGLLSLGTWSTQTLATFTLSGSASSFTTTSSKGDCGVSGGKFSCGSGVSLTRFSAVRILENIEQNSLTTALARFLLTVLCSWLLEVPQASRAMESRVARPYSRSLQGVHIARITLCKLSGSELFQERDRRSIEVCTAAKMKKMKVFDAHE